MENAVEAIKMAFAMFIFTMALSLAIFMFGNATTTADAVLHSSDIVSYIEYDYKREGKNQDRIVGLETIIPTIYKYYKENYTIIFKNANGSYMTIYETQTNPDTWSFEGYNGTMYGHDKNSKLICSLDVNEEISRREPWTGNSIETKKWIDILVGGGTGLSFGDGAIATYNGVGIATLLKDKSMKETILEYTYGQNSENNEKNKKKRVIVYTIIN